MVVLLTKFEGRMILGVRKELVGAAIFGVASLTDWLDGYLARRRGQITALGQFIDNQTGGNWGALFAMSVVSLVPVFIAFLVGQRFLIRGIATTGIK